MNFGFKKVMSFYKDKKKRFDSYSTHWYSDSCTDSCEISPKQGKIVLSTSEM